jgi:hypothetical protein
MVVPFRSIRVGVPDGGEIEWEVGVEDYMGCASVHGLGPSMAIFDTLCLCVSVAL